MSKEEVNIAAWLNAGGQRRSVALGIERPMAGNEILQAARKLSPQLGRWDVSKILKALIEKGLVYCINPDVHTGKLFWLTDYGRQEIGKAFHLEIPAKSAKVDWRGYSFVVAAPLRMLILLETLEVAQTKLGPQTCVAIRRRLFMNGRSYSIYHVMRAVYELRDKRLLRCIRYTTKRHLRMYSITQRGKSIAEELKAR